jgi:hypothetical protein
MTITLLLAYVCTTAAMDSCSVWEEGRWTGSAAPIYCTAERDVATIRSSPDQFTRYECESFETGTEVAAQVF